MIRLIACCSVALLTACASRLSEYPGHFASETRPITIDGKKLMLTHNKTNDMLLVYLPLTKAVPVGLTSGATLGSVSADNMIGRRDAEIAAYGMAYLDDPACRITMVDHFDDATYELTYECTARQH